MQLIQATGQIVLAYCKLINFETIFDSDVRTLFAILGLLLSSVATRADELPVIKDSEAVRYLGKNVEVRGFVVSVTISRLGTAFINFGRDYPKQTFAGFVEAGSKMATDKRIAELQGKFVGITGKIELYQGKPEIKVMSTDQIKVLDPHLAQ
jgi:DNA/RNA endonuclease YhcR with UshA esterase domain